MADMNARVNEILWDIADTSKKLMADVRRR